VAKIIAEVLRVDTSSNDFEVAAGSSAESFRDRTKELAEEKTELDGPAAAAEADDQGCLTTRTIPGYSL
jgi:hypothetical protein